MLYLDKGYIGRFEMADKQAAKEQIGEYVRQLKKAGHRRIIAPINGNTWHEYRLVSWCGGHAPFAMEPQNPLWYNEVYTELGFKPIMKYRSDKFHIGGINPAPKTDPALTIRGFQEGDIKLIYDISIESFSGNFLYEKIAFEEFNKLYRPFLPMIDKDLVVIAEIDGAPIGFMFTFIPTGGNVQILKTMAVLPWFRGMGIGSGLMEHVLAAGREKGADTAIAALMADNVYSADIIAKYGGKKIREYTLYSLEV